MFAPFPIRPREVVAPARHHTACTLAAGESLTGYDRFEARETDHRDGRRLTPNRFAPVAQLAPDVAAPAARRAVVEARAGVRAADGDRDRAPEWRRGRGVAATTHEQAHQYPCRRRAHLGPMHFTQDNATLVGEPRRPSRRGQERPSPSRLVTPAARREDAMASRLAPPSIWEQDAGGPTSTSRNHS